MKPHKNVKLISAKYQTDYKFLFVFSNGKASLVDFKPTIIHGTALNKYLDIKEFKKININTETGDIHWGKDWDMCFHIEQYYNETSVEPIKRRGGRKPIEDKKMLIRLYIRQSKIEAVGGVNAVIEKCMEAVGE